MVDKYQYKNIEGIDYAILNKEYKKFIDGKKFEFLLSKSDIPKEYFNLTFDNYQGEKSISEIEKCMLYSTNCKKEKFEGINLYLTGGFGTQKTTVACSIGKVFLLNNYTVKFVYASELIDYIMKNQGFNSDDESQKKINSYLESDLLIIDDFGKGTYWKNNPDLIIEAWDKFLRKLISKNKRIIMTSNLSLSYIKEHYKDSLYFLLHRSFEELYFYDSIHRERRERFDNLWE